jgi:hypothetical protein
MEVAGTDSPIIHALIQDICVSSLDKSASDSP